MEEDPARDTVTVGDVMTRDPVVVGPDTPFEVLVATLVDHDVSAVPVVDGDRLVGVVSEADLMSRSAYGHHRSRALRLVGEYLAGGDPQWLRKAAGDVARDVMSSILVTVTPADDVGRAARLMLEHRIKRLVVVDDERRVVGMVTRHDLLRSLATPEPRAR